MQGNNDSDAKRLSYHSRQGLHTKGSRHHQTQLQKRRRQHKEVQQDVWSCGWRTIEFIPLVKEQGQLIDDELHI